MKNQIQLEGQVPESLNNQRLDAVLGQLFPEYSRNQFKQWIESGAITVNGVVQTKPKHKVQTDQTIKLNVELVARENWQAQDIPLDIIFEDDDLLILNKPPGIVVHPGAGVSENTLVNALLNHSPELETVPRAGLIHRLDKDTSGLLIVAKNLKSHHALAAMMKERLIKRQYRALVHGHVNVTGTIDKPIGRHHSQRTRMAICESGREAVTHYRVARKLAHHTELEITLETGRTHQIRVHFSSIMHPVVGDSTYGGKRLPQKDLSEEGRQAILNFNRQALHAEKLSFIHPFTNNEMEFIAPLPKDFADLLAVL